jgi:hypothetical protein
VPSVTLIFLSSGHYMKRKRQTVDSHLSSSDDGDNHSEMPSKLSIFPYRYIERNFSVMKISRRKGKIITRWLA